MWYFLLCSYWNGPPSVICHPEPHLSRLSWLQAAPSNTRFTLDSSAGQALSQKRVPRLSASLGSLRSLRSITAAVSGRSRSINSQKNHTNPGFREDLKHLGQPLVPFVSRHLKTQEKPCQQSFFYYLSPAFTTLTWDGKYGNRVRPAVSGPCPLCSHHTCHSRAPAPPHTAETSPPALGGRPAGPGCGICPHWGSAPSVYTATIHMHNRSTILCQQ